MQSSIEASLARALREAANALSVEIKNNGRLAEIVCDVRLTLKLESEAATLPAPTHTDLMVSPEAITEVEGPRELTDEDAEIVQRIVADFLHAEDREELMMRLFATGPGGLVPGYLIQCGGIERAIHHAYPEGFSEDELAKLRTDVNPHPVPQDLANVWKIVLGSCGMLWEGL